MSGRHSTFSGAMWSRLSDGITTKTHIVTELSANVVDVAGRYRVGFHN